MVRQEAADKKKNYLLVPLMNNIHEEDPERRRYMTR
jgi:hypothetical protein